MEKNAVKVTFKGNPVDLLGNQVKVGDKASDFTVTGAGLSEVKLSDFAGKVKIISIFPSLDTPVCATQNIRFNKEAAALHSDIVILSVSVDLPFAQSRFCGAEGIDKLVTVSDYKNRDFSSKYGFLIDGLFLLARGIVVVDKTNTVQHVEYVPEITMEPDYEAALKVAKNLV